jgi:hypothetical protein
MAAYLVLLVLTLAGLKGAKAGAAALGQLNELTPFSQCGGVMDISCPATSCRDAPWRGFICTPGYRCGRQNKFYWQCVIAGNAGPDTLSVLPKSDTATEEETSKQAAKEVVAMYMRAKSSETSHRHRQKNEVDMTISNPAALGTPALEVSSVSAGPKEQCGGSANCEFGSSVCGDRQWTACPDAHRCVRITSLYWQCIQLQMLQDNTSDDSAKSAGRRRPPQHQQATLQPGQESHEHEEANSSLTAQAKKADQAPATKPDNQANAVAASKNSTQAPATGSAPLAQLDAHQTDQVSENSSSSASEEMMQPKDESRSARDPASSMKDNVPADLNGAPDAELVFEFAGGC